MQLMGHKNAENDCGILVGLTHSDIEKMVKRNRPLFIDAEHMRMDGGRLDIMIVIRPTDGELISEMTMRSLTGIKTEVKGSICG